MKKFYVLTILTLIFNTSYSQQLEPENAVPFERVNTPDRATQGWYSYAAQVIDLLGNYSYFRNNIFPDSTVVVEFSNGYSNVWKHSLGQVFDPSSLYFDAIGTGHPTIDNQTAYQIDSIGLWYRYFRHQDTAPDTLIVQIYHDDDINFTVDPGWSSGASYANVAYDYTIRKGANSIMEIEYLLTNDDSATTDQGFLSLPIGMQVDAGEKIAVTYTYFPGNPYNVGDTIDQYAVVPPTNKINALILYEIRDETPYIESGLYNNELRVTTAVRYNINTNGWNGDYIPGTAYASPTASTPSIYHLDVDFYATTCDPIVSEYTSTEAACGDSDGSSTISVTSGNGAYSFLWANGSTLDNTTGLTAGVYDITITDTFGCSEIANAVVSNNMVVDVTITDVLCNGDANGSISLVPVGTNTPYTYNWAPSGAGFSPTTLSAGDYFVTTTDSSGCVNIQLFEITEPAVLTSAVTSISESVDGLTGSASVAASGGTGPYSYNWDGGETAATAVALASGVVWVTVTDANGCISISNTSMPNSIMELSEAMSIDIYPNPSNGEVNISSATNIGSVSVFNMFGQKLFSTVLNKSNTMLDLSSYENGVYLLSITTRKGTLSQKLIIQ